MIGIDAKGVRPDGLNLRRIERFVYEYDFGTLRDQSAGGYDQN
jgi:hypothetical protein